MECPRCGSPGIIVWKAHKHETKLLIFCFDCGFVWETEGSTIAQMLPECVRRRWGLEAR